MRKSLEEIKRLLLRNETDLDRMISLTVFHTAEVSNENTLLFGKLVLLCYFVFKSLFLFTKSLHDFKLSATLFELFALHHKICSLPVSAYPFYDYCIIQYFENSLFDKMISKSVTAAAA